MPFQCKAARAQEQRLRDAIPEVLREAGEPLAQRELMERVRKREGVFKQGLAKDAANVRTLGMIDDLLQRGVLNRDRSTGTPMVTLT